MHFLGTISAGAGAGANNQTGAARASLDLGTKTTHDNTVLEAVDKGTLGNSVTIAFVADGPAAGSVTVVPPLLTIVVHFKDGVTTVKNVEDAIAALAGASALVRVKTPGTAGNILVAVNDEFTATPLAAGVGFRIPQNQSSLYLMSDTDGVQVEFGSGDTFATTAARGIFVPAAGIVVGPFPTGGYGPIVAVWNPTAGGAVLSVYAT